MQRLHTNGAGDRIGRSKPTPTRGTIRSYRRFNDPGLEDGLTLAAKFKPFSSGDSVELVFGDSRLTVESSDDKVCFTTDIPDIRRDAQGLRMAQALLTVLAATVHVLEADLAAGKLPDQLALIAPTVRANPFG